MNPKSTQRFRRATALLAIAWAFAALALGVRGQADMSQRARPPFSYSGVAGRAVIHGVTPIAEEAGLDPGDRILSVDGLPVADWMRAGRWLLEPDRENDYLVRKRDGTVLDVALAPLPAGTRPFPVETFFGFAIPAVGAVYLGIGLLVWVLRRERRDAWALLVFNATMAAQLFISAPTTRASALIVWANMPLIGAASFFLFTVYPFEPPSFVRRPGLRAIPWALAFLACALIVFERWLGLPAGFGAGVGFFMSMGFSAASLALVAEERWRNRTDPGTERADILLLGGMVGFLPVIGLMLFEYLFGTTFPWYVALLGLSVFPAAVGFGIARNQLFDIRLAARSSAAYGAVTLAITGLFALTISFTDALFAGFNVDARTPGFSIVFLFFAILIFNPVRNRVQSLVDAFFDRDRAGSRRAVREISEAMVSMLSVQEIVERILVAVTDSMGLERALVMLLDEGQQKFSVAASRGDWDDDAEHFELAVDHPLCRQLWMRREELTRSDFDDEEDPEVRELCRDAFDTLDVELLVPVLYGVDLLGIVAVGRKVSGDRLASDDRQLLRTLANQSSIAIENAKAFDEIAKLNETLEARVEERTDELRRTQAQLVQSEKMRSLGQLVAGVAHELNNPIGFVHANLQLLHEYIDKLDSSDERVRTRAREAIGKLLARSREGTERVKQIVQDLRTFSRMDQAELQDADLNQEIDRTLALAEPRLKDCVRVERDFAPLPRVRCYAGQLNQVFMNLVMNACDAVDGQGALRIRTRPTPDGVRLEFTDDGPGLAKDIRDRIFEPFFTTKAVGQGTGLGLSISHGIVERHGGRMSVDCPLGGGTVFKIELPRIAKVAEV
ncbi:MAG TPA: ATP-binding protein [Myxococcota bacterium]|nr:ATP-binding protein [Myxococcota bacterium]